MWGNLEDAVREGGHRWLQTFHFEGSLFDHFFKTDEKQARLSVWDAWVGVVELTAGRGGIRPQPLPASCRLGRRDGPLALAACERYPQLSAAVLDLPNVFDVAKEFVSRSPYAPRVELLSGDFFADPLPAADLFALGRIVHDWSEEKILALLRKIHGGLPRRGALLLAERLLDEGKSGPVPALMQSLNMLVCTEGKERTLGEYRQLLLEAGFAEVEGRKTGAVLDAMLAVKE